MTATIGTPSASPRLRRSVAERQRCKPPIHFPPFNFSTFQLFSFRVFRVFRVFRG